jgi:hypothetical protein
MPETLTIPSNLEAFAGVAGLLAVATVLWYGLARNRRYESDLLMQRIRTANQKVVDNPEDPCNDSGVLETNQ